MVQHAGGCGKGIEMRIEEKINPVNGATAENNTYEYEFIYNFVVEQK